MNIIHIEISESIYVVILKLIREKYMLNKIVKIIKNPKKVIIFLSSRGLIKYDDRKYLEYVYKEHMGKNLNLDNPKTFNEKLQWLKLNNRNNMYTKLVDKYEVREYVSKVIGSNYLIPLLGVFDSYKEIDFDKLPNQFVLKLTHDSGTVIICKDKTKLNRKQTISKLKKGLKRKYFYLYREWPYKNVKPRIIAEKYMKDNNSSVLNDYKFYCFNGEPKMMFIITERGNDPKINFFDMDFNEINLHQGFKKGEKKLEKPKKFDEMIKLARKLSYGIPHVRVDFYIINGKVYFGELTFFDSAGLEKFEPEKYDEILGSYIDLNKIKK